MTYFCLIHVEMMSEIVIVLSIIIAQPKCSIVNWLLDKFLHFAQLVIEFLCLPIVNLNQQLLSFNWIDIELMLLIFRVTWHQFSMNQQSFILLELALDSIKIHLSQSHSWIYLYFYRSSLLALVSQSVFKVKKEYLSQSLTTFGVFILWPFTFFPCICQLIWYLRLNLLLHSSIMLDH